MVPMAHQQAPPGYAYMMQPAGQMQQAPIIQQQQAARVQQQNSYLMQPAPVMSQQQPTPSAVPSGGGGSRWVVTANGQYMFV